MTAEERFFEGRGSHIAVREEDLAVRAAKRLGAREMPGLWDVNRERPAVRGDALDVERALPGVGGKPGEDFLQAVDGASGDFLRIRIRIAVEFTRHPLLRKRMIDGKHSARILGIRLRYRRGEIAVFLVTIVFHIAAENDVREIAVAVVLGANPGVIGRAIRMAFHEHAVHGIVRIHEVLDHRDLIRRFRVVREAFDELGSREELRRENRVAGLHDVQ